MTKNSNIYFSQIEHSQHEGNTHLRYHFWYDKAVGPHEHDFFEFFIVMENRLSHTFNGETGTVEKGTLCLIRPGDVHKMCNYANESSIHFNLSVSQTLFEELCRLLSPDLYNLIMQQTQLISYKLKPEEYDYFAHSVFPSENAPTRMPMIMKVTAQTFLLYLQAHLSSAQAKGNNWPQWLIDFLDKLSSPKIFNLPLSQIYSLSSYSQTRLNTLFKQYLGTSLIDYITKQKIHYACNLLYSTNYKISYIYNLAGFNSLSGFNHAFKKITGLTPSEYKKQCTQAYE